MSEEVIELSIDETNALRAKLGLKPLKINSKQTDLPSIDGTGSKNEGEAEELSLTVGETNDLRAKLGLAPLRVDDGKEGMSKSGRKPSEAVHAPAPDVAAARDAKERIEESKMKRGLERNLRKMKVEAGGVGGIGEGGAESALSWADKMRLKGKEKMKKKEDSKAKKKKIKGVEQNYRTSIPNDEDEEVESMNTGEYTAGDLEGLSVSHAESEFQEGKTTILTLADAPLLEESGEGSGRPVGLSRDEAVLENVNLRDDGVSTDNLRKKREVEMGTGHAGGYAGYDDDEFVELGGSGMVSNRNRVEGREQHTAREGGRMKMGFRIGEDTEKITSGKQTEQSDLFASSEGRSISLVSDNGPATNIASDFLTVDEQSKEEEKRREQKRQKKLFKKTKKDKKKKKNRNLYKRKDYGDEDDEENGKDNGDRKGDKGGSILDDLEATAVGNVGEIQQKRRTKRRRVESPSDNETNEKEALLNITGDGSKHNESQSVNQDQKGVEGSKVQETKGPINRDEDEDKLQKKREKFDAIMEKGNIRTDVVFGETIDLLSHDKGVAMATKKQGGDIETKATSIEGQGEENEADNDEDDTFLNAALAKARRLRKLRALNAAAPASKHSNEATESTNDSSNTSDDKGADKIVRSVKVATLAASKLSTAGNSVGSKRDMGEDDRLPTDEGVSFEFDETREFTRALRAKAEQAERPKRRRRMGTTVTGATNQKGRKIEDTGSGAENEKTDDMEELAEQIQKKEEENINDSIDSNEVGGFGSTAATMPVGRGVSAVLNHLRHTGEITKKHAGKEELRGRAKDKRTYEDYEALNLKDVVKIDPNTAQEKDLEFANREIKLEYRDEFGRLLTRKEAYRKLCYQFHGYGSSKKNEERRLRQVAREHAEGALASRQVGGVGELKEGKGTLGALKVAQRATGKAFVVHRT